MIWVCRENTEAVKLIKKINVNGKKQKRKSKKVEGCDGEEYEECGVSEEDSGDRV